MLGAKFRVGWHICDEYLPCTTAAQLSAATAQNGTQANTVVKGKTFVHKVSLMGNPEPHPNSGNASSLVNGKLAYQKVLINWQDLNHPNNGTASRYVTCRLPYQKVLVDWQGLKHTPTMECKQPCQRQTSLPEGVVNGKDPAPHPNNGNGQKDRGGKGLCDVAPAADAPQELLHEGDVTPQPPVTPAEPDLHASLTPPAYNANQR